jgi:hypothetical protein
MSLMPVMLKLTYSVFLHLSTLSQLVSEISLISVKNITSVNSDNSFFLLRVRVYSREQYFFREANSLENGWPTTS